VGTPILEDSNEAPAGHVALHEVLRHISKAEPVQRRIEHLERAVEDDLAVDSNDHDKGGILKAMEPLTGKVKWEHPWQVASWSGTLSSAGNLVFSGSMTGEFFAFDARTGEKLWSFQTSSAINAPPVTWEKDGTQYVAVASGIGTVYLGFAGDERLKTAPIGGSLWTFALRP
jgi:outer membrane protein assembly factor BamB